MKHFLFCTFLITNLFFSTASRVYAQIGEARNAIAVGFNGGVALNSIAFDPSIKQSTHNGPTFGLTLRLTSEKYFKTLCALQLELNYSQIGWTENIHNSNDVPLEDTYSREMNYIQVPLLARLGWGHEKKRHHGLFPCRSSDWILYQ